MAYDPTIPAAGNDVRGVSGDLVKIKNNFVVLDPVATSGLHGLASGGLTPASGQILLSQGGAGSDWYYEQFRLNKLTNVEFNGLASGDVLLKSGTVWTNRELGLDDLAGVTAAGATSGQALISDGAGLWTPGSVAAAGGGGGVGGDAGWRTVFTYVSGVNETISDSTTTVVSGWQTTQADSMGVTMAADGSFTIPAGSGFTHIDIAGRLCWAGDTTTPNHRDLFLQWYNPAEAAWQDTLYELDGTTPIGQFYERKSTVGNAVVGSNDLRVTMIPVSGGDQFRFRCFHDAGNDLDLLGGGGDEGTGNLGSLTNVYVRGHKHPFGGSNHQALGLFSMASGQTFSVPDSAETVISGIETERINTGGFTIASGLVTVPTGSGYTHVDIETQISWTADTTGDREIYIYKDGGPVIFDLDGTTPLKQVFKRERVLSVARTATSQLATRLVPVSGGDTFEVAGYQNSTGALDVVGGATVGAGGQLTYIQIRGLILTSG